MSKIYIVTWANQFFGSAGQSWLSLDIKKISKSLHKVAINVDIVSYRDLLNIDLNKNDVVIYCSSDEENMRAYLKDLMFFVNEQCLIIPSYTALLAHENKGFQQLMRKYNNFGNLGGDYSFDYDELKRPKPYVFKKTTGAGSSGVMLIKDDKDENRVKSSQFDVGIKRKIIKKQRQIKLNSAEYNIYAYRHKGFSLAVSQDFIENLKCDYKVLIFGKRFFVLRRDVRDNDFRASGSGKLIFSEVPKLVLEFAKEVFDTLQEPYASLDIAISGEEAHLIEYQILNFGPYALKNSLGYYICEKEWRYIKGASDLEDCFSHGLIEYIKKNVKTN